MAIEKIQAIRGHERHAAGKMPLFGTSLKKKLPLWRNFTVISTFVLRSSNRLVCLNAVSAK